MGRLSQEIEAHIREYYKKKNGHLIIISEGGEASDVSRRVTGFCDQCKLCLASAPVVSLGEFNKELIGSNLFAVGLIDISNKNRCPLVRGINF